MEPMMIVLIAIAVMGVFIEWDARRKARKKEPRALLAPPVFRVPDVPPTHISRPRAIIVDSRGQATMPPTTRELLDKYRTT